MEDWLSEGVGDFGSGHWGPLPAEVVPSRSFTRVTLWVVCELLVLLLMLRREPPRWLSIASLVKYLNTSFVFEYYFKYFF